MPKSRTNKPRTNTSRTKTANAILLHVGTRIRMRRIELGITQTALGRQLGVTFQQIQKYENGANAATAAKLLPLAQALQVDVGFFYRATDGAPAGEDHAPGVLDRFAASKEGIGIARDFLRIKSAAVRTAIAAFVRTMGEADAELLQAAE